MASWNRRLNNTMTTNMKPSMYLAIKGLIEMEQRMLTLEASIEKSEPELLYPPPDQSPLGIALDLLGVPSDETVNDLENGYCRDWAYDVYGLFVDQTDDPDVDGCITALQKIHDAFLNGMVFKIEDMDSRESILSAVPFPNPAPMDEDSEEEVE